MAASVARLKDGRGDLPVRHARGLGHHHLIFAVGDVQRGRRGDEKCDRHQQGDDLRGRQDGHPQEGQHRLAILDDGVVDLAKALRKQGDKRKTPTIAMRVLNTLRKR